MGGAPARHRLVCVDDDAQGETIEACLDVEIAPQRPSEDAWGALALGILGEPKALGAHLRTTQWRTATAADRDLFQAPFRAGIRLDAYQLLPLQRALALPRVNLLIADDVGLGKTVEAGLIVRELLLRRRIDTVVVAAPASMVLQWQDEMAQKFGLDFIIVDREHLLHTRRTRGFGANPWALGSNFVLSHSVLSNETYVAPLRARLGEFRPGSLLILDEAHHAAPSSGTAYATESQMTMAVRELAGRFEHRLFLSATPHNGHSNSFATLLEILDPYRFHRGIDVSPDVLEPVMVRRLKEDLRQLGEPFPERRVEPMRITDLPADAPELRLAEMLSEYGQRSGGTQSGRFLLAVLQQRLFSSLAAFQRTLQAHRRGLQRRMVSGDKAVEGGEAGGKATEPNPGTDEHEDSVWIEGLTVRADAASDTLAQVDAMLELTREYAHRADARIERIMEWIDAEMLDGTSWRERRLIIFTEWEDTRRWLEQRLREALASRGADCDERIAIFTGQTTLEERDRIKRNFNAPFDQAAVRILICTDAAREGINLQARCHDLIHFDLPWNPSRLEQRNGRIDRKLQPHPVVTCRYFVYEQREEDRVLEALVRKTERVRRELGAAGQVIRDEIEDRLAHGIERGTADQIARTVEGINPDKGAVAFRELGDDKRLERLRAQERQLARARDQASDRVGVDPANLRDVVELSLGRMETALAPGAYSVDGALTIDPSDPAFQEPSWQALIDELRPGRPASGQSLSSWRASNPPRGLVFAPPVLKEGQAEPQDVVQLHLEHRLVKRLIAHFVAKGFQDDLSRVAAIRSAVREPRVVLIARLALFGPSARRLHEELVPVTARWRDTGRDERPLEPFGSSGEQTTIEQLHAALREGAVPDEAVLKRLGDWVSHDIGELRVHAEARASAARDGALGELAQNGDREADQLRILLTQQIERIEREARDYQPLQETFDFRSAAERERETRQREADRTWWDRKIERLRADLETEPDRVRESYEVRAERLDPVGLIYLWPAD